MKEPVLMKLLFSEARSDYQHYIFPYAIWAVPEAHETPADVFNRGFLPNSPNLDRFYLCRNIRVELDKYQPSSENRRILRKGGNIAFKLILRSDFDFTPQWREFCKSYADAKFGQDVMSYERLDKLMSSPIISHLVIFTDNASGKDIGLVMLYLQQPAMAFYYYAFYDLQFPADHLGMFMMTAAAGLMKEQCIAFLYLGSCYSRSALYKTQFPGVQFFNGNQWSKNIAELKYLIDKDNNVITKHLLENEEYRQLYYPEGIYSSHFSVT